MLQNNLLCCTHNTVVFLISNSMFKLRAQRACPILFQIIKLGNLETWKLPECGMGTRFGMVPVRNWNAGILVHVGKG